MRGRDIWPVAQIEGSVHRHFRRTRQVRSHMSRYKPGAGAMRALFRFASRINAGLDIPIG